jgi:hypothetical protein
MDIYNDDIVEDDIDEYDGYNEYDRYNEYEYGRTRS